MASMRQPPVTWRSTNLYVLELGKTTTLPAWSCPAVCSLAKCCPVRSTREVGFPSGCGFCAFPCEIFGASMIVAAHPGRQLRLNCGVRYSRATACLCLSKFALAARKPVTMSLGLQPGPGGAGTTCTPCCTWPLDPCSVPSRTPPLVGNVAQAVAANPRTTAPGAASQRRVLMGIPTPVPVPGDRHLRPEEAARLGNAP